MKSIKFDEKVSQSISKKRQIPLSAKSEICVITTEEGKNYSIKAGVVGWVIDFNIKLDVDMLQKKVLEVTLNFAFLIDQYLIHSYYSHLQTVILQS